MTALCRGAGRIFSLQNDCANLRFVSQDELIQVPKAAAPTHWPTIWAAVINHRQDCLTAVALELTRKLDEPGRTRKQLRREIGELLKTLAERGPSE